MVEDTADPRAGSFGAAAAEYERGRPPYPAVAVDWLVPPAARRVLDLGAGTGKLTRQLVERGLDVVAVEPSVAMREQLSGVLPGVRVLPGRAEEIPLDGQSVDAVVVAQAWHWVNPKEAVPEVARVLSPGGWLGLVWNIRDERQDWVAALGRILSEHGDHDSDLEAPTIGPPFGTMETLEVEWRHRLTPDALVDMVASRSYVIMLAEAERQAVLAEVRKLVDGHSSLSGGGDIVLPYVTKCWRTSLG